MFSFADGKLQHLKQSLAISACLDVILLTLLANIGYVSGIWYCDLLSQFRLVYLLLSFGLAVFVLSLRLPRAFFVCFIGVIVQLWPLLSLWLPAGGATEANLIPARSDHLSVLNFNTEFQVNQRFEQFQELVGKTKPDLIVLSETDKRWTDAISGVTAGYPYRLLVLEGPGMAFF